LKFETKTLKLFLFLTLQIPNFQINSLPSISNILNNNMKKPLLSILFSATLSILLLSCGKTAVTPLSERIAKAWTASIVKEGGTVVYTKGQTSIRSGYSNFRLNLSSTNSATLTEFDGNTFTGTWALSTDEKTLTLSGLSPQPTGTGGVIAYSISTFEDTKIQMVRTTASQKTGNTINDYTLVNP
jgi:hypothetical protein